ncbi:MAG: hypothetical protein ABJZ55_21820 [Fuerstiella sp.]
MYLDFSLEDEDELDLSGFELGVIAIGSSPQECVQNRGGQECMIFLSITDLLSEYRCFLMKTDRQHVFSAADCSFQIKFTKIESSNLKIEAGGRTDFRVVCAMVSRLEFANQLYNKSTEFSQLISGKMAPNAVAYRDLEQALQEFKSFKSGGGIS